MLTAHTQATAESTHLATDVETKEFQCKLGRGVTD